MDDLDDVRAFLGYSTIDLFGVSYGTRAAVAYASRHGEHVRAAILDGAMPADMRFPLYMARDAERSMGLLFRDCAREPACQRRFPDLPARLRKLLESLQGHPRHVRFVHPQTGLPREADIDRLAVATALFASLYSGSTAALVPMLIEQAENGGFSGLLALRAAYGPSADTVAKGLEYSVLCSEDAPGVDAQSLERASAGTFLGSEAGRAFLEPCGFWPVAKTQADPAAPRLAGVAALVVSGEIDPVTPPSWGAEVAALPWKTARHIVVPGTGHSHVGPGVDGSECVVGIVAAFLDAGDASAIDVACAGKVRRPPFLLSPSGPAATP
jgi:pimeloyl-ACP methyl ester carboxylesterase